MPYYAVRDVNSEVIKGVFCLDEVHNTAVFVAANVPPGCTSTAITEAQAIQTRQGRWGISSDNTVYQIMPTTSEQLATTKDAKAKQVESAYMQAKVANVTYNGKQYFADMGSQQTFAHALLVYSSLGATPSGFFVMTANYEAVPMNLTDLKALTATFAEQVWVAFQRYVAAKQALGLATTVEHVNAVTF